MHLKFSFTQDEVKAIEAERILNEMLITVMPRAKELHFSEERARLYTQGFIKAVARAITLDRQHTIDKDTWAISNEYIYSFISRYRGKEPNKTNGRFENYLMRTFLKRDEDPTNIRNSGYNFHSPNSITSRDKAFCKRTYDLHPLLWEAVKLENHFTANDKNWKDTLLTEGIKGISWANKKQMGAIPLYGLTSVETVCINGGNILNVERSENRGSNNDVYGLLQKAPTKWIGRAMKRLNTLERGANKLKTELKRKGRLIHIERMREYLRQLKMNDGYYIDFYRKTSCGRFFGIGMTLQSFSTSMLKTLFRGEAVEIDQSTSHPTIIRDLAADFGILHSDANDYIANKEEALQTISKEARMRKSTVKKTILSVCYGHINTYHTNRHPLLRQIVMAYNSLLTDLKKLLGEEVYKTIYAEETNRSAAIVEACGGWDNLICWKHDGVIMKEAPSKNLTFAVKCKKI